MSKPWTVHEATVAQVRELVADLAESGAPDDLRVRFMTDPTGRTAVAVPGYGICTFTAAGLLVATQDRQTAPVTPDLP